MTELKFQVQGLERLLKDLTRALESCRSSLAIRQRLAAQDLANAGWQHDLSVSQENVANILRLFAG
jgi:hypothetical protein